MARKGIPTRRLERYAPSNLLAALQANPVKCEDVGHDMDVTGIERRVTLVIGDRSAARRPPREVFSAGLTSSVAIVISTYRFGSSDMFLDHPLWLTCVHAVSDVVKADRTQVFHEVRSNLLGRILGPRWPRPIGTLESFAASLDDDGPHWGMLAWTRTGSLVGAAMAEDWYRVGGPEPYHDSYTTRVYIPSTLVEDLVATISTRVQDDGGVIERVLRV